MHLWEAPNRPIKNFEKLKGLPHLLGKADDNRLRTEVSSELGLNKRTSQKPFGRPPVDKKLDFSHLTNRRYSQPLL